MEKIIGIFPSWISQPTDITAQINSSGWENDLCTIHYSRGKKFDATSFARELFSERLTDNALLKPFHSSWFPDHSLAPDYLTGTTLQRIEQNP
jgi:hypothetical protein